VRDPLTRGLAWATGGFLELLGVPAKVRGTTIFGSTGAVRIVPDCDGVVLLNFFLAAVLAFPTPRRLSLVPSVLVGLVTIAVINFGRVVALTLTNFWYRQVFEFTHMYLFQGILVLVTTAIWLVWANYALRLGAGPETKSRA
jgi:exosortase/archaeosortase family protein